MNLGLTAHLPRMGAVTALRAWYLENPNKDPGVTPSPRAMAWLKAESGDLPPGARRTRSPELQAFFDFCARFEPAEDLPSDQELLDEQYER